MILSKKRKIKALIRLRRSVPLLFPNPQRQVFSLRGPYDLLNVILWPMKVVHPGLFISKNICIVVSDIVMCSYRKGYVKCGHNVIHDMTLSTE